MPATLLSDLFTDSDGTALTAHTMTVGGGWTASVGTFQITGNKAVPNSNAASDITVADAGVSNLVLTCDVVPQHVGSVGENDADLIFRYTDSSNYWLVHLTSLGQALQLFEVAGGSFGAKATVLLPFASGSSYAVRIAAQGDVIAVSVDGIQQISFSGAATGLTATKCGLYNGKGGVAVTKCSWDNFLVVASADTSQAPELRNGPVALRAPYVKRRPSEFGWLINAPATAVVPPQIMMPELRNGPNALRAPFVRHRPSEFGWANVSRVASTVSAARPLLFRVPKADADQLARFTEIVANIANSLVGKGVLVQTSADGWALVLRTASGVITFDGRTGVVTLNAADIRSAYPNVGIHDFYAGPGPAFRPLQASDLPSGVGSVTSVDISGPSIIQWSARPITGAGTLIGSLIAQAANTFLRGPVSGVDAAPTFGVLTPADFTASGAIAAIRTALGFGEYVTAYRASSQTITNATDTAVLLTSEWEDSNGFHSLTTNPERLTVPSGLAGVYIVAAGIRWASNAAGARQVKLMFGANGSPGGFRPWSVQSVPPITGAQTDQIVFTPPVRMAVGDFFEMQVNQNSGGDLDLEFGSRFAPNLGMWRIAT